MLLSCEYSSCLLFGWFEFYRASEFQCWGLTMVEEHQISNSFCNFFMQSLGLLFYNFKLHIAISLLPVVHQCFHNIVFESACKKQLLHAMLTSLVLQVEKAKQWNDLVCQLWQVDLKMDNNQHCFHAIRTWCIILVGYIAHSKVNAVICQLFIASDVKVVAISKLPTPSLGLLFCWCKLHGEV